MSERIKGIVVWQSRSVSQSFGEQTVQLIANVADYNYWEVIYFYSTTSRYVLTTGKLPIGTRDGVMHFSSSAFFMRSATLFENSLLFGPCIERGEFYADGITSNNYLIPYLIKFYK